MPGFNDIFLQACRGIETPRIPVWFMRQAGRYLPEYRALREKHTLLEIARTPELAAEVTLQPLRRFEFDAAIVFADILLLLEPMGCPFHFAKGEGPVIEHPIRTVADIDRLKVYDAGHELSYVMKTIEILTAQLQVPLIGFAGAPFTVASYMIEGGHSRHFQICKSLMWNEPAAWKNLLGKVTDITISYLDAQIRAGAQAIQVFDSWAGCLAPDDYEKSVLPHTQKIFAEIKKRHPTIPRIHFGVGTGSLLPLIAKTDITVAGIDWQTPLDRATALLGKTLPLQGNLDPLSLFAPAEVLRTKVQNILTQRPKNTGYIFNLGHGILPETSLDAVKLVIDEVHRAGRP